MFLPVLLIHCLCMWVLSICWVWWIILQNLTSTIKNNTVWRHTHTRKFISCFYKAVSHMNPLIHYSPIYFFLSRFVFYSHYQCPVEDQFTMEHVRNACRIGEPPLTYCFQIAGTSAWDIRRQNKNLRTLMYIKIKLSLRIIE